MRNFCVKYKGVTIGQVVDNKYTPNYEEIEKVTGVFNFLKNEIENVENNSFFSSRIENCKRFDNLSVSYSTDNYEFVETGISN